MFTNQNPKWGEFESKWYDTTESLPSTTKALSKQHRRSYRLHVLESKVSPTQPSCPEQQPVVLVHGMVVGATYLKPLGECLSPWFRVYIPELPGYGLSNEALPKDEGLNVSELADALAGWLEAAGLVEEEDSYSTSSSSSTTDSAAKKKLPPFFVGNSMGCQIIAELAVRHPDYVRRCVLQGPTKGANLQSMPDQMLQLWWNGRNEPPSMALNMYRDYYRAGIRRAVKTFHATRDYHIEETVKRLNCPALVVTGELDNVSTLEWGSFLCQSNPKRLVSQVVILDSPHTANYTTPGVLARVCRAYFTQNSNDASAPTPPHLDSGEPSFEESKQFFFESVTVMGSFFMLPFLFTPFVSWSVWFVMYLLLVGVYLFWRKDHRKETRHYCNTGGNSSDNSLVNTITPIPLWKKDPFGIQIPGVADFDSATGFLRATALAIVGEDFTHLGRKPFFGELALAKTLDSFPASIRTFVYSLIGALEATPDKEAGRKINASKAAEAVVAQYPSNRKYPMIALGSSCGALVHAYAAMGIPWLPQTLLFAIRRSLENDTSRFPTLTAAEQKKIYDLKAELEWGKKVGKEVLDANPDLQLHHMADPNQDALMTKWMSYFRVKRLTLGKAYKRFIKETLEPGGTLLLTECTIKWPCVKVSERHYYQPGAVGGIKPEEYTTTPNEKVNDFIWDEIVKRKQENRSDEQLHWNAPQPDCEAPEAEWGFVDSLREDVEKFAKKHGYRIERLVFDDPQHVSPLVADLYREWYRDERGLAEHHPETPRHLFGESFILVEPWWCLRQGCIPYWGLFPVEKTLKSYEEYLKRGDGKEEEDERRKFASASTMLFSHGVESIGYSKKDDWNKVLNAPKNFEEGVNKTKKQFVGVREELFPKDFESVIRYHDDAAQVVDQRFPMPMTPMSTDRFKSFLEIHCSGNSTDYQGVQYKAHQESYSR